MDLYEALLKRRSVRKYSEEEPDRETIQSIEKSVAALKPLCPEIKVKLELIGKTELPQFFTATGSVKAPYYAVITSEDAPLAKANAGFLGEQLTADLTRRGMGTCWSGMLKASKTAFPLPYIIAIGFGYPKDGPPADAPERKLRRKKSEEICLKPPKGKRMKKLVEAVRIAPSAANGQPWRLEPDGKNLHVFCAKPSFLTPVSLGRVKLPLPGTVLEKLQEVDCGIALAHVWLCAEHLGTEPAFQRIEGKEKAGDKLIYVMSAVFGKGSNVSA